MRVAVIGLGGTGSAALRFLAQVGHESIGFEQFRIGHDRGSSHGESRIIRYLYSDSLYTTLMADAYPLWRDLERQAGAELLVTTGGIFIGHADHPDIVDARSPALEAAGRKFELLTADNAGARFPDFQFSPSEVALYQSETGFLRASDCVAANISVAREAGAVIHEECTVDAVCQEADRVIVSTAAGDYVFDRAIVTAGPWMGRMLVDLGLPVRVSRQYVFYVAADWKPGKGEFPAWIDVGSAEMFYGIPHDGRLAGIKVATHQFGPTVEPGLPADAPPAATIERLKEYLSGRFPALSTDVTRTVPCLYTLAPDEDFILDYVPADGVVGRSNVVMVSGCSGHGFKFTVLLGKIAAGMAAGSDYERDIRRFRLSRFG